MADVIKLRVARKKKQAAEDEARARENRILFGRSRQERAAELALRERQQRVLEAHRREDAS